MERCDVPSMHIVIVNWNTCDLLFNCISSIIDHDNYIITVVDNASTDASYEMLVNNFSFVNIVRNSENVGFARANNIAIKLVNEEYVCLLNSDTIVSRGCFESMLSFMNQNPHVVACAPALRLPSGRLQTGAGGYEPTVQTVFNYFFFLSKIFPVRFRGMFFDQKTFVDKASPVKVDWLSGACLLVRTSVIDRAGMLDESKFMYSEDVEWCRRLRQYGDIYYLPYIEIVHYHGASSNNRENISVRWLEALISDLGCTYNVPQMIILRLVMALGFFIRYIVYSLLCVKNDMYHKQAKEMKRYFAYSLLKCQ